MATRIEKAEGQTKTDLTHTQKKTGDYSKGKVVLRGLPIVIENPKGSTRVGMDAGGNQWRSEAKFTYGYIDNTVGADKDGLDIYLGPLSNSRQIFDVYVINQVDPITRVFDEHKIMFGFANDSEAREGYLSCYAKDWQGLGSMKAYKFDDFVNWVNRKTPIKNVAVEKKTQLIKLEGEVLEDVTLVDLQTQAGNIDSLDTLVMTIASPGGDVSEGIKIMMWMDYLSSKGIKVITVVTANAYSIASLIMLAADHVLIGKYADVMVHNPMIPELKLANANELEVHIKSLRKLESTMYELYEIFTDLSFEEIKSLMDNETYLNAEQAVKLGFADEIADIQEKPKVMAINKSKIINMKKTLNILHKVIALVSDAPVVNQLYYDDKGGDLEIYQADPSTFAVGDRTSVENGVITLSDGSQLTIENYVITAIDRTPVETPAVEAIVPSTEAPIAPAAAETVAPVAPVVAEGGFNVGPAPAKPEEPAMKTEVTKTETTKTEPVPVAMVVEAPAVASPVAAEMAPTEGTPAEESTETPAQEATEMMAMVQAMCDRIDALEERVAELESGNGEVVEQMKHMSAFEDLATKAIDTLAENTVSNFKPAAKAVASESAPSGSIFAEMKKRRGLAK